MVRSVLALALASLALPGCGGGRPSPDAFRRVPRAELGTAGVVIEDVGGAFTITSDGSFETPFWSHDCPARATTDNYQLGYRLGARPVRVHHPSFPGVTIHGLLAFCMVHPNEHGPVSRSYALQVPDEYVYETEDGRVSVVYEPTSVGETYGDGWTEYPAWILWLSRRPLAGDR